MRSVSWAGVAAVVTVVILMGSVGLVLAPAVTGSPGAVAAPAANSPVVATPTVQAATPSPATQTSTATQYSVTGTGIQAEKTVQQYLSPSGVWTGPVQQDTQRVSADQARVASSEAAGLTSSDIFPPSPYAPVAPPSMTGGAVVPSWPYPNAPAPMGLGYYGTQDVNGQLKGTVFNTTGLEATFSTGDNYGVQGWYPYYDGATSFGGQLNAVLVNITLFGQSSMDYQFWQQNVIGYNPAATSGQLSFVNNIWNFSNPASSFPSNGILKGNGRDSGGVYEVSGPKVSIAYPFSFTLYINTTVNYTYSSGSGSCVTYGCNEVYYNYSVYNALGQHVCPTTEPTGDVCGMYDNVLFNSQATNHHTFVPIGSAEFQANGLAYNPFQYLPNDYEWDLGIGSSDGAEMNDWYANATLGLYYFNSTTDRFQAVPSAYDFGSETGESSYGSYVSWNTGANGQPYGWMTSGPSILQGLWNITGSPATPSGADRINYAGVTPGNAFIAIAPGSGTTNTSQFKVSPTFGWFNPTGKIGPNIYLSPGTYSVWVMLSGYVQQDFNITLPLGGGTYNLVANLARQATPNVYTPMYAFSASDLANLSTSGSGTVGSPYVLFNSQTGPMSGVFSDIESYFDPVWTGIYINNTKAYTTVQAPSLEVQYPAWLFNKIQNYSSSPPGQVRNLPTTSQLQIYFYHAENVSLVNSPSIGGWFVSSSYGGFGPLYNVYVNAGKNDLIANNQFNVSAEGVEFLGAGASVSPSTTFSAVGTTYTATFTETGLPGGTPWSVTLGGNTLSSTTGSIVFTGLPNGVYSYAVGAVNAHTPSPASGSITISGASVSTPIVWSAVGTTYAVVFSETGLATNSPWSVTLNGVTQVNASSSIVFVGLANGGYSYTVNGVRGYVASPSSGSVTVSGAKVTQSITFTAQGTIFSISFSESGLPSGAPWSVTFAGQTFTSVATSIVFPGFQNGAYSYTINPVSGYTPYNPTGTVTVSGSNQNNYVWGNTFTPWVNNGPYLALGHASTGLTVSESGDHIYNNAFYTNGTASSSSTYFNSWNATGGYQPASNTVTVNGFALTGSILGQNIQGGNYWRNYGSVADPYGVPYVARASSPSGSASIGKGADFAPLSPYMPVALAATVPTALGVGLYAVTFTESNLPASGSWTVRLAGVPVTGPDQPTYTTSPTNTSTTSTLVFYVPNGTYTFTVTSSPTGSSAVTPSASTTVNGGVVGVSVVFQWQVTFKQTGLPGGSSWAVTFNGKLGVATSTHWLNFTAPSGSWGYTVSSLAAGYTATPSSGTQAVGTTTVTVSVTFTATAAKTYSIYFTASGIYSGTSWSVTINSNTLSSTGSQIVFTSMVANTYTYTVTAPAGYTANPASGSVTVSSASASVGITFTPVTYTVTFTETGLTSGTLWGLSFNGVIHWGTAGSGASSITFQVTAGAYTWLLAHTPKTPNTPSGSGTLSGPLTVTITFS